MRFTKNGKIDTTFGINGFIDTTFRLETNILSIGILNDNSIIVGCIKRDYPLTSTHTFIEKYSRNGIRDTNFGTGGQVTLKGDF